MKPNIYYTPDKLYKESYAKTKAVEKESTA
jgi:hypothetical protein